jgi:hypothetical protein
MDIKLKASKGGWGVTGFFEGYKLVFSGLFDPEHMRGEKFRQIFPIFQHKRPAHNPNTIVSSVDVYTLFSFGGKRAWVNAYGWAKKHKHTVKAEDIFLALLEEPQVENIFKRLKVSTTTAVTFLSNYVKLQANGKHSEEEIKILPFASLSAAIKLHSHEITPAILMLGLMEVLPAEHIVQAIFANIGLTREKLEVLTVWLMDLDYEFPKNSQSVKMLYCLNQAKGLEEHFGYFFEFPAIEKAAHLSSGYYQDMRHLKAFQYLVKAGLLAKSSGGKNITENLVQRAADRTNV